MIDKLTAEVEAFNKDIKALEKKRDAVQGQINVLKRAALEKEYPAPAALSWDYIFSVPFYVLNLTPERDKAFEDFTGRGHYYFPILIDSHKVATKIYQLGIYLHHRYPKPAIEDTILTLWPMMNAALKAGQTVFELMGRADHLCMRVFEGKWYVCSERFESDETKKPSLYDWSGSSWEDALRFYNRTNEDD